jgi:HSP20 family protein
MSQVNVTKNSSPPSTNRGGLPSAPFPMGEAMSSLNPLSLMRRFTDEMDRLFGPMARSRRDSELWMPPIEVTEQNGYLVVSADLPGLRKEDVKVEVSKDTLMLEGERKQTYREKGEGYHLSERNYGRFYRSIPMPEGANIDKAVAELVNGTLEISIPIPETPASRRQIPVQESKARTLPPS